MKPSELKSYKSPNTNKDKYCSNCDITYKKTSSTHCGICGKKLILATENSVYQQNKTTSTMKICPTCKRIYNHSDYYCLNDNTRLVPYTDKQAERDQLVRRQHKVAENIPKCPTCHSTNISKISGTKKAIHGIAFGLLSKTATSQFECKNCGYKW